MDRRTQLVVETLLKAAETKPGGEKEEPDVDKDRFNIVLRILDHQIKPVVENIVRNMA